jgi:biotin carboxyl carrier protein
MTEYKFKISGKDYTVSVDNVEENMVDVVVNGTTHTVELEKKPDAPAAVARPVVQRPVETAVPAATGGSGKSLKSPLPGVILDFYVKTGDAVKSGQKVLLLEAMKMENNIDSDRDGTVLEIRVAKGDSVNEGDVLMVIG